MDCLAILNFGIKLTLTAVFKKDIFSNIIIDRQSLIVIIETNLKLRPSVNSCYIFIAFSQNIFVNGFDISGAIRVT